MEQKMEGGCSCQRVRYRLIGTLLIVQACHCRWCQHETGTAHALNALYEADRVVRNLGSLGKRRDRVMQPRIGTAPVKISNMFG